MSKESQRPPLPTSKTAAPSEIPPVSPSESREETKRLVEQMLAEYDEKRLLEQKPAAKREPVLAVGRIVRYVLKESEHLAGEIRPAIVTRIWSKTCAQITVIPDGSNDFPVKREVISQLPPGTVIVGRHQPTEFLLQFAVSSAHLDQENKQPGTFHFPELD